MSASDTRGMLPVTDDPETGGFFAAAQERRLVVQRCDGCGNVQQPPRPRCIACRGTDLGWLDLTGHGAVHSWTVVEHQVSSAFQVPYTILLVDADVGVAKTPVRFLAHLPGRHSPDVGAPVRVVFEEVGDRLILPNWTLDI